MKSIYCILIAFVFTSVALAQDFPKNSRPGKCYVKKKFNKFEYDKALSYNKTWKETPCPDAAELNCDVSVGNVEEFILYQTRLIKLGYDIKVDGKLSRKFMKAHNNYICKQKKEARKKRKASRKN